MSIFLNGTAGDFPLPKFDKIITVQSSNPLSTAVDLLQRHNIYSLPVISPDDPTFVEGMIDVLDIVCFLASKVTSVEGPITNSNAYKTATVAQAADFANRSPYTPVASNTPMIEVVDLLGRCGFHRCLVHDLDNNLINIITQTAVINLLSSDKEALGRVASKTVSQLTLGSCPVYSVDVSDRVIDAFAMMRQKKCYGVAVVNKELKGAIVTVLSAKDARFICNDLSRVRYLHKPIQSLISALRASESPVNIMTPSITCSKEDTVAVLIQKFSTSRVHRLYTVNQKNQPDLIITLTDILQVIVSQGQ